MLVHAHGFAINRGVAEHVRVELDVRGGLPAFSIIGLGGSAARDARERVQAAVLNSGYAFPRRRLTVNLAPAVSPRSAPPFDLPLACCVLASEGEIDPARLARVGLYAALGLGGDLRAHDCAGLAAEAAEFVELAGLIVAAADLAEARAAPSAPPIAGLASLREVVGLFAGGSRPAAGAPGGRRSGRSLRPVSQPAQAARAAPRVADAEARAATGVVQVRAARGP